ncbi:NAD(P)H-hydrate dehydratase [Arenibacter sp. GZD96]|uniref:NAD(P)H-hydrate dehydratase n=1 Tax=Aurantibrevibacter litoralis TaxID=3106030 RepID=UPI002AFE4AEE|nr:NAD(P)H-hydrate dehydratase [Arenibacter sp. GZD-96]MEA1784905.1 NAD(P)H-hydrate dehydratase [Arenibacter sp. GZD-96]
MKIFTTPQIYEADRITLERQGITSDALMERAGKQVFHWMHSRLQGTQKKIHIFCGIGNNGGDGLVVGRHLLEHSYKISVYIVAYSTSYSKDFAINLKRLKDQKVDPIYLNKDSDIPTLGSDDYIVDAIFGIGLNRPPDAWVGRLIATINRSNAFTVSVDIPSGLYMDQAPQDEDSVVRATYVLSFQFPKLPFFLPQTGKYIEQWEVVGIGLDIEYIRETHTAFELMSRDEVRLFYVPRKTFSHKGTYGHSLIIGGSNGKVGAAMLASEACITSGSGLVTAYIPQCGLWPMQTALPEIMAITDVQEHYISDIVFGFKPSVIGLGMGLGRHIETQMALEKFLKTNKIPLVLDADALNIVSEKPHLCSVLPPQTVLTPHPKELERLIGSWNDDFDKLKKTKAFSKKYDCIVVIKGAYTMVVYENRGYINSTGNPGMATAGSGDVLAGIITGLIAQGYKPLQAAILGVYVHGRSGDLVSEKRGQEALTARSIIRYLGKAYLDLIGFVKETQ